MTDTQREAETQAEGEAGSLWGANVGLDPRTPGSHPEPKADAQPPSHPGIPQSFLPCCMVFPQYTQEGVFPLH